MFEFWLSVAGRFALWVLAFFAVFIPFIYVPAIQKKQGHFYAISRVVSLYIFTYLYLGSATLVLYGCGISFDQPDESCGIGCIEGGMSHFIGIRFTLIIVGLASFGFTWWLGRIVESIDESWQEKLAKRIHHDPDEVKRLFESWDGSRVRMDKQIEIYMEQARSIEQFRSVQRQAQAKRQARPMQGPSLPPEDDSSGQGETPRK